MAAIVRGIVATYYGEIPKYILNKCLDIISVLRQSFFIPYNESTSSILQNADTVFNAICDKKHLFLCKCDCVELVLRYVP